MKNTCTTVLLAIGLFTLACHSPVDKGNSAGENSVYDADVRNILDAGDFVAAINQKRKAIEDNIGEPVVIATADLKEKIKQKWEKIHFYVQDDRVVRIKTYPYNQISTRTEEFYLENWQLMLAVIEDDGQGERGKTSEKIDKMYYFNDNELIKMAYSKDEVEYAIKDSDGKELLSEVKEYIDIYVSRSTK